MIVYLSPAEAGTAWGISRQRVSLLCKQGRVAGAFQDTEGYWRIPRDADKPAPRKPGPKPLNGKE